jgi:hypothetical protein
MAGAPIIPTFFGFLATPMDAIIILEAAIRYGMFPIFDAKLEDEDVNTVTRSGSILVVRKTNPARPNLGGVGRWHDQRAWSDRRSLPGGYKLYREMCRPGDQPLTQLDIVSPSRHT